MHNNGSSDGQFDVVVVGGGIVGAATFYKLQKRFPERRMVLIDKMPRLADHQTGNNSGVIHSGLYYKPGSLKATNCVQGRRELVQFCKEHDVPHDVCGKVVVAADESELPMLEKIHGIGKQNEIENLERKMVIKKAANDELMSKINQLEEARNQQGVDQDEMGKRLAELEAIKQENSNTISAQEEKLKALVG